MASLLRSRATAIWLLLVAASLFSWESTRLEGGGMGAQLAYAAILIIAFVKVRFIGLDFMELRGAPWPIRIGFEIWAMAVCIALLILCLAP
jgi:hypothetical protein